MLRCILTNPPNMGLDDIVPIKIWHLPIGFYPNLIFCMLGNMIERCNMKLKLPSLGELSKTCAEREEVITGHGSGKLCDSLADVVDPVALNTEAMWVVRAVY